MQPEKSNLLEESQQKQKSGKWKWWGLLLLTIGGAVYWFYFREEKVQPIPIEYTRAIQEDFKIFVEEEGQIKNPRIVELSFLKTGKLARINFEEGDRIKTGQEIARLEAQDLWLSIQSSKADVSAINADILKKKSELTDLDVRRIESELTTKESNIDQVKREAEQAVGEAFDLAKVEISTSLYELLEALQTIDDVFRFDSHRGGTQVYRAFNDISGRTDIRNQYESQKRAIENHAQDWESKSEKAPYSTVSQSLWKVKERAKTLGNTLDQALSMFETANNSDTISNTDIENYRDRVRAGKNKMNEIQNNLVTHKKLTEKVLIDKKNKIDQAFDQIEELTTKIETEKESQTQKEQSKAADLKRLEAQKSQSRTRIGTAQYEYSQSILKAPIDGKIVSVNNEVGEIVGPNEIPLVEILSDQAFTVEIEVEELDIVKIARGQKAKVSLASIKEVFVDGKVTYIANKSEEDENGIITYLVRVSLESDESLPIREGMTATVQFTVDASDQAILLPVEAVYQNKSGDSLVLKEDGSEQVIETGLSNGILVEIKSGVKKDETVILNPKEIQAEKLSPEFPTKPKKVQPSTKSKLKQAGFTDKEIRDIRDNQMNGDLEKKLKKYLAEKKKKKEE